MAYSVVFIKGDEKLGATPWSGDLASAKKHATDHFDIQKQQRGATRVIVVDVDDNNKIVFSHPGDADA